MELASEDGAFVGLRPVRYQFPDLQPAGQDQDWDANWLIIRGDIRTAGKRSWCFEEPCLTTWEARLIGSWLRDVASATVRPAALAAIMQAAFLEGQDAPIAMFTEPNLAFSVQGYADNQVVIRVHLSLETSPPWLRGDDKPALFGYFVAIGMQLPDVARAADIWDRELSVFPVR